MLVWLEKEDLINLIKGTDPGYVVMVDPLVAPHGTFSGSYDRWNWNYDAFENYTKKKELWKIYLLCKKRK